MFDSVYRIFGPDNMESFVSYMQGTKDWPCFFITIDSRCGMEPDWNPPVSSNMASWKINYLYVIFLLKPPFLVDFQLPRLITGGYQPILGWYNEFS